MCIPVVRFWVATFQRRPDSKTPPSRGEAREATRVSIPEEASTCAFLYKQEHKTNHATVWATHATSMSFSLIYNGGHIKYVQTRTAWRGRWRGGVLISGEHIEKCAFILERETLCVGRGL